MEGREILSSCLSFPILHTPAQMDRGFSAWAQCAEVGSWGKRVSGGGNVAQGRALVRTNLAGPFHLGDLPGISPNLVSDPAKLEDMVRLKMI